MRLICPNCAAQYEVDEGVIPESGRDVQCANCGDTWFQERRPSLRLPVPPQVDETDETDATDELETGSDQDQGPGADHQPAEDFKTDDADSDTPDAADDTVSAADDPDDEAEETPQHPPIAQAKVDPSVLDILRSEAQREATAREAETSETNMPASDAKTTADSDKRRIHFTPDPTVDLDGNSNISAGLDFDENGDADDEDDDPGIAPEQLEDVRVMPIPPRQARPESAARTLPDIDELNSSLRSSHDKARGQDGTPAAKARARDRKNVSSRIGFYLAVILVLLLVIAYILATQIGAAVPAAQPYLDTYVNLINSLRLGLAEGYSNLLGIAKDLLAKFL